MKNRLFLLLLCLFTGCRSPQQAPPAGEPLPTPERWYVIVDAGHGGFDAGASGTDTGVKESELNLQVAQYVQEALAEAGVRVLMTRTDAGALGDPAGGQRFRRGFCFFFPEIGFDNGNFSHCHFSLSF